MVAGISPTGPNISGLCLPPYWHFLPLGTCTHWGWKRIYVLLPTLWETPVSGGALLLGTHG